MTTVDDIRKSVVMLTKEGIKIMSSKGVVDPPL
jgi:hypothetical protein